jgi:hypothetical protein
MRPGEPPPSTALDSRPLTSQAGLLARDLVDLRPSHAGNRHSGLRPCKRVNSCRSLTAARPRRIFTGFPSSHDRDGPWRPPAKLKTHYQPRTENQDTFVHFCCGAEITEKSGQFGRFVAPGGRKMNRDGGFVNRWSARLGKVRDAWRGRRDARCDAPARNDAARRVSSGVV